MPRYFMELAYRGKQYHGWQRQPNAISVQQTVEERLSLLLRETISLTTAGRTDAGVHALQTFAHFDVTKDFDTVFMKKRLNAFLPEDIVVKRFIQVPDNAHARYDATEREYVYKIIQSKNPFMWDLAWELFEPLNMKAMNTAASVLMQYEDFQSFSKVKTDVKTFNCDIRQASWRKKGDLLIFRISANRFLRNMVRAIVGTLVEIGLGKIPPEQMHTIIQSKNRSQAGPSAPAQGLYLYRVKYKPGIID